MSDEQPKKSHGDPVGSQDEPLGSDRASRHTRPTRRMSEPPVSELRRQSASVPRESEPPTLLAAKPGRFCTGYYRGVSLIYWHDQATKDAIESIRTLTRHMIQANPEGHSNVAFVRDGVPAPEPELRDLFSHVFDGKITDVRCVAIVVEGGGFWASSLRTAITGISMAAENRPRISLHTTLEEAASWLAPAHSAATGTVIATSELRTALRDARAAMERAVLEGLPR